MPNHIFECGCNKLIEIERYNDAHDSQGLVGLLIVLNKSLDVIAVCRKP